MDSFTVYNLPPAPPNWDRVGIFYVTFCCIWSSLVATGMFYCWLNRNTPVMRVRGIFLSFSSITFLHCYWVLAQVVYPIGGTMNVILAYDIQYFFMGMWFPLGIALFHASNMRFLHVAKLQKQFTHPALVRQITGCNGAKTSLLCRIRNLNYSHRIMIFIGSGMLVQSLLTLGMWLACKKYHPTYGIPGTEMKATTLPEQLIELSRGWEWWPSLLWQFIWTWIVAPILIWRAWNIRDTMGWRTQTIACCLSNLHATPMFLAALYAPAFQKVNTYFAPSEWIHLSIMFFEIFTVFVPVFQIIRLKMISRRALESNARWETASQTSTLNSSTVDWKQLNNLTEKNKSMESFFSESGERLITMKALEHVLHENPGPLLEFSALNDFSGENIAFLNFVSRWKASHGEGDAGINSFRGALQIYVDFIGLHDAQFPLNLPSAKFKKLESVFELAARAIRGESHVNPATPFEMDIPDSSSSTNGIDAEKYAGTIPFGFDGKIFDDAQDHIKYLVLTNTWPKFIHEMQNRRKSIESDRTDLTETSQASFGSQMSDRVRNLLKSIF